MPAAEVVASKNLCEWVLKNGIAETWTDAHKMQEGLSLDQKGWKYEVEWKQSEQCDGFGVYACENIPEGAVIRQGIVGQNMTICSSFRDLPKLTPSTFECLENYAAGFGKRSFEDGNNDADQIYFWLPGCGINHSAAYAVAGIGCLATKCPKKGVYDIVSTRPIAKGEELVRDYATAYGKAPLWYEKFVRRNVDRGRMSGAVFVGLNDFV